MIWRAGGRALGHVHRQQPPPPPPHPRSGGRLPRTHKLPGTCLRSLPRIPRTPAFFVRGVIPVRVLYLLTPPLPWPLAACRPPQVPSAGRLPRGVPAHTCLPPAPGVRRGHQAAAGEVRGRRRRSLFPSAGGLLASAALVPCSFLARGLSFRGKLLWFSVAPAFSRLRVSLATAPSLRAAGRGFLHRLALRGNTQRCSCLPRAVACAARLDQPESLFGDSFFFKAGPS